jgi:hypothetical protein
MHATTLERTEIAHPGLSPYASKGDFCRIFEEDMNGLYLLSFLLTADHSIAEQCFVGGLHIAREGNPVFKEWAESWARRAIILNAIRMIRPRLTVESTSPTLKSGAGNASNASMEQNEIVQIVDLPVFERFAFVMTVLERYSDQECSLHLSCTRGDVVAARTRALQRIGQHVGQRIEKSAELHRKLVSIVTNPKTRREDSGSESQMAAFSGLAITA